ncbi:MAG TPA: hypothetical protein VM912_19585 [Terriglobales bacterium]|nr:hypothetical protein [Terriglobales bacterium]
MSKSDPIEKALNRLGELRQEAPSAGTIQEVRQFLNHRSNLIVGKAAKVVSELKLSELLPDLVSAFRRFMANPQHIDKRCAAVTWLLAALYELDYSEPDVYLQGLRHVQLEASFGPPVDTAATLRGISAQGLLRTRYSDAMAEVLPLLVDSEPAARIGAVRAFAVNGGNGGVLVLRLKVLTGDPEPEVLAECFSGLLSAAPEQSLRFVAGYMDVVDDSTSEAAMWALGQSRLKSAFDCLREKWERTVAHSSRKTLLAAIAASRRDEAIQFLCSIVAEGNSASSTDAVTALSSYKSSQTIQQAVADAVRKRGNKQLQHTFEREFVV